MKGVLGAVLAGGASRRLGRDKAAATVGGVPMIERAVRTLTLVCDDVVVVSSRADTPLGPWQIIPDLRDSVGPLGGLEAALAWADERGAPAVFVLACDLPLVEEGVLRAVLEGCFRQRPAEFRDGSSGPTLGHAGSGDGRSNDAVGRSGATWACAAARDGRPDFEPLCALYSTACLGVATHLLDEGARAARALFEAVGGLRVDVRPVASRAEGSAKVAEGPARLAEGPVRRAEGPALLNVNTEDDLARADGLIGTSSGEPQ